MPTTGHARKERFVEEIEEFLHERLQDPLSPLDQFIVYQEAFDMLINHFERYKDRIRVIKDGYDAQLAKLRKEFTLFGRRAREVLASKSNLDVLEHQQRSKYEDKKQHLIELQRLTEEQIAALKEDLVDLTARQDEMELENRGVENSAHQQWLSLQELISKSAKKEKKREKVRLQRQNYLEKKLELEREVEDHHGEIAATLDAILIKKRKINAAQGRIESLKIDIEKMKEGTRQKREQIEVENERITELKEAGIAGAKVIADLVADNTALMLALTELAAVNSEASSIPFDESEDPLRLVQQFIEHNPGK
jgi:chromosome segregation ATPase